MKLADAGFNGKLFPDPHAACYHSEAVRVCRVKAVYALARIVQQGSAPNLRWAGASYWCCRTPATRGIQIRMAETGLLGPYPLKAPEINGEVSVKSAGVYALDRSHEDGPFHISYVGRSDTDLNARLHEHA